MEKFEILQLEKLVRCELEKSLGYERSLRCFSFRDQFCSRETRCFAVYRCGDGFGMYLRDFSLAPLSSLFRDDFGGPVGLGSLESYFLTYFVFCEMFR